ncbi:hypothetical protein FRC04_009905 [Tulasnella sp. 424]|nr:hypothetical protein FRC04_009905 [Tulasnella sp. 424]KAG8970998.1 hypothetical protein FRC05_011573 [Tulasnella sp. 425]
MKAQGRFIIRRTPAVSFDLISHPQPVSRSYIARISSPSLLSSEPTSASGSYFPNRTHSGTDTESAYHGAPATPPQRETNLPDIFVFTPSDEDPSRPPNSYCAFRASDQPSPPTPDLDKLNEALEYMERITEKLPTFGRIPGIPLEKMAVLPKRKLSVDMPCPGLLETEVAAAAVLLESSYTAKRKSKSNAGVAKAIKSVLKIGLGRKSTNQGAAQKGGRAGSTQRTAQPAKATTELGSPHVYHYTLKSEHKSLDRQDAARGTRDMLPESKFHPLQSSNQPFQSFVGLDGSGPTLYSSQTTSLPSTNCSPSRRKGGGGVSKLFRKEKGSPLWTSRDLSSYTNATTRQSTPHLPSRERRELDCPPTGPLSSWGQLPDRLYMQTPWEQSAQSLPLQKSQETEEKGHAWVYPDDMEIPPVPPLPLHLVSIQEIPTKSTAPTEPLSPPPPSPLQPAFELDERPRQRTPSYRKPVPEILSTPPRGRESPIDPSRLKGSPRTRPVPASPFSSPLSNLKRAIQSMSPSSTPQNTGSPLSSTVPSPRPFLNRFPLASPKRSPVHSEATNSNPWLWAAQEPEPKAPPIESRRRMMQLDSLHFADLDFDASKF